MGDQAMILEALAELPHFADRYADWAVSVYDLAVYDPRRPFMTGGCLLFARALRVWSRARVSIGWYTIVPPPDGLGLGLGHAFAIAQINNAPALTWVDAEGIYSSPPVESVVGELKSIKSKVLSQNDAGNSGFVADLAARMDAEIGNGAELFATLPLLPLDAFELF